MARFPSGPLSLALLCAIASAQGEMKSHLIPITGPIRHAGTFHVATGTWTRGAEPGHLPGQVIYDNNATLIYFTTMLSTERFQHRSRLPSPNGPTTDSVFYGSSDSSHRYDERPGCADRYTVTGFEVAYCTSHVGTIDWEYQFASSWSECDVSDMVPQHTITVTGLPGGRPSGGWQNCWIAGVDLSGMPNGGIELSADGDGSYQGPSTLDQFGWSFGPTSPTLASDFTGPLLAGNYTCTGARFGGILTPRSGTDGTIWDSPIVGAGPTPGSETIGTGMSSNDFFRDAGGPTSESGGPGCYTFGGAPHADFYLRLFSTQVCGPNPLVPFCAPGVGGILSCPCGNPQVPAGWTKGCNNFYFGGTGGAVLSGSGVASISGDTLALGSTAEPSTPTPPLTVLFQGTTGTANLRFGAGVRCVSGVLKRLYKGDAVGGAISFPNDGVAVHDRSAARGFPIVPPITLDYFCAYRNTAANGHTGCPGLQFGFNSTNAGAVYWVP